MKIRYLGTAAAEGVPALFCRCDNCCRAWKDGGKNIRTRSSVLIDDDWLIDFPPDIFAHVLKQKIDLAAVHHLFITHSHHDHFYPDDLAMRRPPFAHIGDEPPLHVYGNEVVIKSCEKVLDLERMSPWVQIHTVQPFEQIKLEKGYCTALPALHNINEDAFVFLFERDGKKFFYGNDSGVFTEPVWRLLRGRRMDIVSLDCTFGLGKEGSNHMGLIDCAEVRHRMLAEGIADKNTLFMITHFSHNTVRSYEELYCAGMAEGFTVSYDGMVLEI